MKNILLPSTVAVAIVLSACSGSSPSDPPATYYPDTGTSGQDTGAAGGDTGTSGVDTGPGSGDSSVTMSDTGTGSDDSSAPSDDTGVPPADTGTAPQDTGTTQDSAPNTATWAYLYPTYFAGGTTAQTPGHCSPSCHHHSDGNSATDSSLVQAAYGDGSSSRGLTLYGGNMPEDNSWMDPTAMAAVTAWANAGFP